LTLCGVSDFGIKRDLLTIADIWACCIGNDPEKKEKKKRKKKRNDKFKGKTNMKLAGIKVLQIWCKILWVINMRLNIVINGWKSSSFP